MDLEVPKVLNFAKTIIISTLNKKLQSKKIKHKEILQKSNHIIKCKVD
jgi:hypothetical protein